MEETGQEIRARGFLRRGRLAKGDTEVDLMVGCEWVIQQATRTSLKRALVIARRFELLSRGHSTPMRTSALRAFGRLSHQSGLHRPALSAYVTARSLLRTDRTARARVDRMLIDIYMYLGQFDKARAAVRRALSTFRALSLDADRAQTEVNYANLLHRQDRHREAERLYRKAAEYFETTDNHVATARCYYNRANTLVQLFDMDTATKLYEKAHAMWQEAGCHLDACDARYGIAWLHMLAGRFHSAMIELSACERAYREGGDPRGEALCILDRAEVFLNLGLVHDAHRIARDAKRKFTTLGLRYETAKAALFQGQASSRLGRKDEAAKLLAFAQRRFRAERNWGFVGVASLTEAELAPSTASQTSLLSKADRHFSRAQLPYWRAICDLQLARQSDDGDLLKKLSVNPAVSAVPHLFALHQLLIGDREYRRGLTEVARRHWTAAADRLDAVRAQLPPLEIRSAFSHTVESPHRRLVDTAVPNAPLEGAIWSERLKTAGVWTSLRSFDDNGSQKERSEVLRHLNSLAHQVSSMAHRLGLRGGNGREMMRRSNGQVTKLRRQIRDTLAAIESTDTTNRVQTPAISDLFQTISHRYPIVQFYERPSDLVAFVHDRGTTEIRMFPHGREQVTRALRQWRFLLESQLLNSRDDLDWSIAMERGIWTDLGRWLWSRLGLRADIRQVLILAEGELASIPWNALIVDDRPLIEEFDIILAPSLRHHARALKCLSGSTRIEIFQGRNVGLAHSDDEVHTLLRVAGANGRLHAPATRLSWPVSGAARIWHYSGHAEMNEDNAFYSFLDTADGPTFAADFRLMNGKVDLVTLAACRSGEQLAMPGEESTGLVRSLLEMGARNVLAGYWPVSDEPTAVWMQEFYKDLLSSGQLLPAVRKATIAVRRKYPSAYHWAGFAVYGAGDMGDAHV